MSKSETINLPESYIINRQDSRWGACDDVSWVSINIYNRIREIETLDKEAEMKLFDYLVEVRFVPQSTCYKVELIYKVIPKCSQELSSLNPEWIAGIDLGVNNLAAIISNKLGCRPILVIGRPLKDTNQFYNKRLAQLKRQLLHPQRSSHRFRRLIQRRNRRIDDYLHGASKHLIDTLSHQEIGKLVIGKSEVTLGKRNNQNFVQMLTYNAQLVGIEVIVTEESYTRKCNFLDQEGLCHHLAYLGKRIKRGLFRATSGQTINADVNASANIIRKVFPNAFADGLEDIAVRPVWALPT